MHVSVIEWNMTTTTKCSNHMQNCWAFPFDIIESRVVESSTQWTYMGRACNLARITLTTPDAIKMKHTTHNLTFIGRRLAVVETFPSPVVTDATSYSNSGNNGIPKSSSMVAKESAKVSCDQLETRRTSKLRLWWSPAGNMLSLVFRFFCYLVIMLLTCSSNKNDWCQLKIYVSCKNRKERVYRSKKYVDCHSETESFIWPSSCCVCSKKKKLAKRKTKIPTGT